MDVNTVKSVIYHEYLHQIYKEHDKNFKTKERLFPDFDKHNQLLNDYFSKYKKEFSGKAVEFRFDPTQETIFCIKKAEKMEEFFLGISTFDFNHFIKTGHRSKMDFNNNKNVIWLVEHETDYFVAGWSKDVTFTNSLRRVPLDPIWSDAIDFDCFTESKNTVFAMNDGFKISKKYFPKNSTGIFTLSEQLDFNL